MFRSASALLIGAALIGSASATAAQEAGQMEQAIADAAREAALVQPQAETPEETKALNRRVCRRVSSSTSRLGDEKICMTQREWNKEDDRERRARQRAADARNAKNRFCRGVGATSSRLDRGKTCTAGSNGEGS